MLKQLTVSICVFFIAAACVYADGKVVTFKTSDGVQIEADYYPPNVEGDAKAPVAILIHMYPADRSSWKPLVPMLHDIGFAVLAYDIRGNGGSTQPADMKLAERYKGRDPSLFADAWKDVEAAKKWLADQKECDTTKTALVGASIGCSISLQYCSKDENVKTVVCLSPGTNYFGVDSKAHIKACRGRRILLIAPEAEYGAVEELIAASEGYAKGTKYPGSREQHGTGMFKADYGERVMRQIVKFVGRFMARSESEDARKIRQARQDIAPMGRLTKGIKRFHHYGGAYPETLAELIAIPKGSPHESNWKGPYVENADVLMDPWGNPYGYRSTGAELHNKSSFDLWTMGPDGKDGTDDDIKNWR